MTNVMYTKDMLISERCLDLFLAGVLKSNANQLTVGVISPWRKLSRMVQARLVYNEDDVLHYLNWSQECDLEALDLPLSNSVVAFRGIESQAPRTTHASIFNAFKRDRVSLSTFTLQEFHPTKFLLPEGGTVAKVRTTITALAIERWKLGA